MVNNVSDRTELLMEVHDGMRQLQRMHDVAVSPDISTSVANSAIFELNLSIFKRLASENRLLSLSFLKKF